METHIDDNDNDMKYLDSHPYQNPMEDDHWSDVATRILIRAVAIVALAFSIVWAFKAC